MYQENLDVELILLDARSNAHVERLRQQRLICGWRAECVDEWREQQLQKNKYMFWIVLKPSYAERDALIKEHIFHFPLENPPLMDTAPILSPHLRIKEFVPIGHLSLDLEHYTGDPSIANPVRGRIGASLLYISPVLRGLGLARQSIEAMKYVAAAAPFYGKVLTAETLSRESSKQKERYAAFGVPTPKYSLLAWYESLGFKQFKENKTGWTETDPTGKVWTICLACIELDIRKYGKVASASVIVDGWGG